MSWPGFDALAAALELNVSLQFLNLAENEIKHPAGQAETRAEIEKLLANSQSLKMASFEHSRVNFMYKSHFENSKV